VKLVGIFSGFRVGKSAPRRGTRRDSGNSQKPSPERRRAGRRRQIGATARASERARGGEGPTGGPTGTERARAIPTRKGEGERRWGGAGEGGVGGCRNTPA